VVSPAIVKFNTNGDFGVINGIEYDSFDALKPFVFLDGTRFQGPDDAIIDDVFVKSKPGYKVGDPIMIMNQKFRVSGIVEQGKGARKAIPLETMEKMIGAEGKVSIFYIRTDDPSNQQAVIDEIHKAPGLADYPVMTMDEWMSQMTPEKLPGFNIALDTVTGIAVIIGFLVIFQSMYTAVLERTREIGILKAMGASKPAIVMVVVRETALLAVAGVVLGVAGTYGVRLLIAQLFPTQHFEITSHWIMQGTLIAFGGSLLGALYPAWMAARKDPIDALAYE
jgi:putative ABC transport system permease protein